MPGDSMPIFGYHAVYERDHQSAIRAAAEQGFGYVQFDLNVPAFYIDRLSRRQLSNIKSEAASRGIRIAFHAPGDNVGLFVDYPLIRKGILDHIKLVLQKANYLNAHHLTVHPLNPPSFRRADTLQDIFQEENHDYFKEVLKENLMRLADASDNVLIIVENCDFQRIAIDALDEMFQEGTDILLALDWAKMHTFDHKIDEKQNQFFLKHRKRIQELHLHDMDSSGRSHLSIGQGSLDYRPLLNRFYDPSQWLTIEVRPFAEAARARGRFLEMLEGKEGT
jgi:sugar phosphate isomerase/epimerase